MLVQIDPILFNQEDNFRDIDYLFHFFEDGKHQLIIYNEDESAQILDSNWINRFTDEFQYDFYLFLQKAFSETAYLTSAQLENEHIIKISQNEYDLTKAKQLLNEKLYIIIENKENDHYFLDALINTFRKKGKKLRKAKTENWIDYSNGGGKNTITQILPSFFEDKAFPPRLFVLVDSDKYYDGDTNSNSQRLIEKCNELNVKYHILHKREVENYLPDIIFDELRQELQQTAQTYKRLNPEQKDYYDLEKGFGGNKSGLTRHNELFDVLEDNAFNHLKFGFNIKNDLCKIFSNESINRLNLKQRCEHQENPNELETILEKITALL